MVVGAAPTVHPPAVPAAPAPRPRPHRAAAWLRAAPAVVPAVALLAFLALPVLALVARGLGTPGALGRAVGDGELLRALGATAGGATAATLLAALGGTPLAWRLARRPFRGQPLVEAVLDLPLVLPHPVAGLALLLVLGRGSPVGQALLDAGLRVVGTPVGTVAAMLFVAAPLYVSAARASFAQVDAAHEQVARTLGAGPWRAFRRVALPLAGRGLLAGAVVAWARAVSEFGAVVVLAYHPRIVGTLAWERFTSYGLAEALPVAAVLAVLALGPLVALRALRPPGAPRPLPPG